MNCTEEFCFKYETHCHTSPVSKCAKASAEDTVRFYKSIGYDGIFITNHFLDGNINPDARNLQYRDQIEYYFSDYEEAYAIGEMIGLKVFPGVELSYKGTDFLIYGLDKEWYKANPDILEMKKTEELQFMMEQGAFVVQAHPYREAHYIDHIRLFPRNVHAVEIINSNQATDANDMAALYAKQYGLMITCGSDNHWAGGVFHHLQNKGLSPAIAGMRSETPIQAVQDYVNMVKSAQMRPFLQDAAGNLFEIETDFRCDTGVDSTKIPSKMMRDADDRPGPG